jgi:TM2 domain-containing membrane protein YozV
MNCTNHPERNAAAFCRECGKPMCEECQRPALGSVYCEEHVPVRAVPPQPPPLPEHPQATSSYAGSPYAAPASPAYEDPASPYTGFTPGAVPRATSGATTGGGQGILPGATPGPVPDPSVHPVLALILGFFPGVGAIYNGQYAKGLVHAVVFGLLVSLASNTHNTGMGGFLGIMIAIWVIYQAFEAYHTARKRRYGIAVEEFSSLFEVRHAQSKFPVGAILLIGVGFILLLDTTDIISMDRFLRYWPVLLIGVGLYLLYSRLNPADNASPAQPSNGGNRR